MESYEESLNYIYGLIKFGIKLGLENPRRILSLVGNPHTRFKSIHVAGTNGKGSTCRMLQSALMGLGYRTGLFTSPHMVRFTERIMVDNEEISPHEVAHLTGLLKRAISSEKELRPTYFEFVTALAFKYFEDMAVEWAVVETGMGGRFDATNVLSPEVSIITTVDIDHRQYLGQHIREIAFEKAGIIKDGIPVVIGPMPEEGREVVVRQARSKASETRLYGRDFWCEIKRTDARGTVFDLYSGLLKEPLKEVFVPLVGAHQPINASLAAEAFFLVSGSDEEALQALRKGLKGLNIKGRFEIRNCRGRKVILDGAHNTQAMKTLFETIDLIYPGIRPVTVFGVMADKDIQDIMKIVLESSRLTVLTKPAYERAIIPEDLYKLATEMSPEAISRVMITHSVAEGMEVALKVAGPEDIVLVTGSFYVVGEVMEFMGEVSLLKDLREGL